VSKTLFITLLADAMSFVPGHGRHRLYGWWLDVSVTNPGCQDRQRLMLISQNALVLERESAAKPIDVDQGERNSRIDMWPQPRLLLTRSRPAARGQAPSRLPGGLPTVLMIVCVPVVHPFHTFRSSQAPTTMRRLACCPLPRCDRLSFPCGHVVRNELVTHGYISHPDPEPRIPLRFSW